jgi:hypothetical protein
MPAVGELLAGKSFPGSYRSQNEKLHNFAAGK